MAPLEKKLNRLTNVGLILMIGSTIPAYLKQHLPNIADIPTCLYSDTTKIIDILKSKLSLIP